MTLWKAKALANAFRVRMRLGLFDPLSQQPFENYGPETVGSTEHHALSADASRQGITLLTNKPLAQRSEQAEQQRPVLPLSKGNRLLVVGPNADTKTLMAGGTGGGLLSATVVCTCAKNATDWCCLASPVEAIAASNTGGTVVHLPGCSVEGARGKSGDGADKVNIAAAVHAAKTGRFDAVVFVIGGDWNVEHEGMDRTDIALPGNQAAMVSAVAAAAGPNVPSVAVMVHGGSMDITPIISTCQSVLTAFYPGVYGAQAIADVVFGDHNPGGKTPYTWYKSSYVNKVSMDDFRMANPPGRSYRYLDPANPDILIQFGHGLSYTTFDLAWSGNQGSASASIVPSEPTSLLVAAPSPAVLSNSNASAYVTFVVSVTNTGSVAGAETVFGYWTPPAAHSKNPVNASFMPLQRQLFDFGKVLLAPGETGKVTLKLSVDTLVMIDQSGSRVSTPGSYAVRIDRGAATAAVFSSVKLQGSMQVLERLPAGL